MTAYTAETTNATNSITATPADPNAHLRIDVNGTELVNGTAATWTEGENTVVITVTNGTSTVYTVTVTKS